MGSSIIGFSYDPIIQHTPSKWATIKVIWKYCSVWVQKELFLIRWPERASSLFIAASTYSWISSWQRLSSKHSYSTSVTILERRKQTLEFTIDTHYLTAKSEYSPVIISAQFEYKVGTFSHQVAERASSLFIAEIYTDTTKKFMPLDTFYFYLHNNSSPLPMLGPRYSRVPLKRGPIL